VVAQLASEQRVQRPPQHLRLEVQQRGLHRSVEPVSLQPLPLQGHVPSEEDLPA